MLMDLKNVRSGDEQQLEGTALKVVGIDDSKLDGVEMGDTGGRSDSDGAQLLPE